MYGAGDTSMRTIQKSKTVDKSRIDVIDLDSPDTGTARTDDTDDTNAGIENLVE